MSGSAKHVVVVGGGIAGLATSYALQEQASQSGLALSCTVLEAESYWGGKILTHRVDDLLIEAGPDSFLSQKPWGLELCAKLGLADHVMNTNEANKRTFVYSKGRLRALPEGLVVIVPTKLGPFLKSGLVSPMGMARMAMDLVLPARKAVTDESLASFFKRRVGREAFNRLVEPLMAGIYAGDAEQMSLQATFPRFQEIEQRHGSLIRGMLAGPRGKGGAASGSRPTRTLFVTLREGMAELVDSLVSRIQAGGAALKLGQTVAGTQVLSEGQNRKKFEVQLKNGPALAADAVVFATPAYVTADLIRSLAPEAAGMLDQIHYASTITVSLAFDRADVGSLANGFGFVVPRVEGRSLLAATWTSLKWEHRAPASRILVRCYLGGVGREWIMDQAEDALVQLVLGELRDIVGLTATPQFVQVKKWARAMPQYTIGHLDRVARMESLLKEIPGWYVTGAAYHGIGVPDCIRDGTDTALKVVHDLTQIQQ